MRSSEKLSTAELLRYYKWRIPQSWRRATSNARMLPTFVIIGAAKCGTTSLYHYLHQHPQILPALHKEIEFFTNSYAYGVHWYRAQFPLSVRARLACHIHGYDRVITGEATPSYLVDPRVPERLAATLPDAKLIVLLRDPVARAYSNYQHEYRTGDESRSFEEAVRYELECDVANTDPVMSRQWPGTRTRGNHLYIGHGEYLKRLKLFYGFFNSDSILVLKSEAFFSDTQGELNRVTDFLGLLEFQLNDKKPLNEGSYKSLAAYNKELSRRLYAHFRPHNEALYEFLGEDFGWEGNDV